MIEEAADGAARWVPAGAGIPALRAAAAACQGCELHRGTPGGGAPTGTVFSKGTAVARVVFVGEQPGDQEDRQGMPFVGPAGKLLDRAMAEVGIDPRWTYVTNSVKHFRFTQDRPGARRVHQTPDLAHVAACLPWLRAELAVLDPELVVVLGATAGRALFGPGFRVTERRGQLSPWPPTARDADEPSVRHAALLLVTVHPSAVLRAPDSAGAYQAFVADLRIGAAALTR
jgi:uracil-DNA glycosylase family protein